MTKSRTLRKAAAVVLSLAMAFSVSTVSTADAAAKNSLAGKTTVKVGKKITLTAKKAGKTVSGKKTVTAKQVKVTGYKGKVKFTKKSKSQVVVQGVTAGKVRVSVTAYPKKGKKFTVKKNITVKKDSTKNEDGTDEIKGKITISSEYALQSDNTVLNGDSIKLVIPSGLGKMQDIIWTCNGTDKNTTGAYGTGALRVVADEAGTWVAKAVTDKGTTYVSNELTVVDKEAPATITGFELLDDYDTKTADEKHTGANVDYKAKTKKLVAHFTVNRLYEGTFGLTDPKATTKKALDPDTGAASVDKVVVGAVSKATRDVYTGVIADRSATITINGNHPGSNVADTRKKDAVTSLAGVDGNGWYVGGVGKKTDFYFVVDDTTLTRGTAYAGYFEQKSIGTTTLGKGGEIISASVNAPYVIAPSKFVMTAYPGGGNASLELQGDDGKALAWMNETYKKYATTIKVALNDTDVIKADDTFGEVTSATITDGKIAAEFTNSHNRRFAYATATLEAGVFGEAAVTLTSNLMEESGVVATNIWLEQSGTTATSALVKFEGGNSKATGTVYVYRADDSFSGAADSTALAGELAAVDTSKAIASATGKASTGEIEVPNAFKEVSKKAKENQYVAVFVPDDQTTFKKAVAGDNATKAITTAAKPFKLVQKFQKYAAASNVSLDPASGGFIIEGKDQFGKTVAAGGATVSPHISLTKAGATGGASITLTVAVDGTGDAAKLLATLSGNGDANATYTAETKDAKGNIINRFTMTVGETPGDTNKLTIEAP